MTTKRWVVEIELELEEDSHPRKFVIDAINECLNKEKGEDVIDYQFVCLD